MASMTYTVYTCGDEVAVASGYAPDLPEGALVHRVTTDWSEVRPAVSRLTGQGYREERAGRRAEA